MKQVRYQMNKDKHLSPTEVKSLRERIKSAKLLRDRLLIEIGLHTGARASEILALTKSSLNYDTQGLFIVGLKSSKDREIPLPSDLWSLLVDYTRAIKTQRLFDVNLRQFHRIWCKYRPVKKKLHSLRHTCAIELYKKHRDLRLVQIMLGHRNIANTMVYADYQFETDELRRLVC